MDEEIKMIDFNRILAPGYLDTFRIGEIAQQVLIKIIQMGIDSGTFTKDDIDKFRTEKGRRSSTFMISKPLLSLNRQDAKGYYRYYRDPIKYNHETLYLFQDWNESDIEVKNNLIQWIINWAKTNKSNSASIPNVFNGNERLPYFPPNQGTDTSERKTQFVIYNDIFCRYMHINIYQCL